MPLEIEYAAHPEDIYADIGDYVKDTLRPNRSNRNCQLALTLLEDRRPDAVSIFEAWKPIGKNYGNAILAALIEENLLKQEITREQFIINLKHAIRIEELRRTKGQSKKEKG